ncbi:protein kinase superfamily protein [Actinidia rufa]|uniref:Serine/threonine-protein kinase PRP4 homolog n=1 Tax=Actinidia rufa TaxID=165716 RepID=A0A7J0GZ70_9ERIC|nr:protein kinase superfamily protein [Actinidia rufa]
MATDSQEPTRRKHRRSSAPKAAAEDEIEESRDEQVEIEEERIREEREEVDLPPLPPDPAPVLSGSRPAYDDMEEGEIVEDEGGDAADVVKKRADSDEESGEIRAGEVRGDSDNFDTGVHGAQDELGLSSCLPHEDNLDRSVRNSKPLGEFKSTVDEYVNVTDGPKLGNKVGVLANSNTQYINGDIGQEPRKEKHRPLTGSQSPVRGSHKQKNNYDDGIVSSDRRKSSSSGNDGDKHKTVEHPTLPWKIPDYDSKRRRRDETDHRARARKKDLEKNKNDHIGEDEEKFRRDEDEQEEYRERIELQLVDQEEDDIDRIKEESRRRRQAILEKYKTQQSQQQHDPHLEDKDKDYVERTSQQAATINIASETLGGKSEDVDTSVVDPSFTLGKSPPQNGINAFERTSGAGGLGEGTPKSERSVDIFGDDIFGESPAGVRKTGKGDGLVIERSGLHDNWDDAEGYYSYRFGEILDGRYEVAAAHGKGVFSTVVRAKDLKAGPGDPDEVAIKIIRNNETMHKAGKEELVILKKLVGADPDNKRHCVRFLSSFKYRNHLCLVFESLHMNLREVLKKFGRNIGLKLTAVRTYAKQLFIALKHLRNCGVLHCDIKPDNMLVNEAKNVLKLCDFGNAMFAGKNEITPYLVSRFYRAPEIILGLSYDHPMDIWSVGCCLFELYTGKVLFPGATNNDMLRLHMELKGPFPKKMLRKGAFVEQHFDHDLNFLATEEDPVTKKTIKRLIPSIKPKDIGVIVTSSPGEDLKMLANFRDLLEKVFVLDPDKRITVSQALSHPFITGK